MRSRFLLQNDVKSIGCPKDQDQEGWTHRWIGKEGQRSSGNKNIDQKIFLDWLFITYKNLILENSYNLKSKQINKS